MTVVRSKFAAIPNDAYQTREAWPTLALLRVFGRYLPAGAIVWEPAAGGHCMSDVLSAAGFDVITSDIAPYRWDRPHSFFFDFLDESAVVPPRFCDAIFTNPPYGPGNRLAVKFARLALQRCPGVVALLLTAKFDFGNTRADLFANNPRFVAKIALTDRIRWFEGEHEGTEDHAWYIWGPAIGAPGVARLFYEGREQEAHANVYRSLNGAMGSVWQTRALADQMAGRDRIACVPFAVPSTQRILLEQESKP